MQVLETDQDDVIVVLEDAFAIRRAPAEAPVSSAPTTTRSNWRPSLLVLVSYLAMAVVYFGATWRDPAHRLIGSRGDPTLFVWYLRWIPWAVAHGHNPLFASYVNAPYGINVMWNTAMLLPSLVVAPVTALWGPIVSYNVLATVALGLSGWTAWWAFRRVGGLGWGAWIAGLAFAFSPFMVSQSLGHLQMTTAFLLPVIGVAAYEVVVTQRLTPRRGGIVLGLLLAAQALTGEELLAIAGVGLAVGTLVLAVLHRADVRARVGHAVRACAWAGGTAVVVAGGPLLYQFLGPQVVHGSAQPPDLYVTDLYAPLVPTPLTWLHTHWSAAYAQRFAARGGEWSAYLGIPLIVLLVALVVRLRTRKGVLAAGITALGMLVLSLGPHLHPGGHKWPVPLPWAVIGAARPLDSLLPVRLMVVVGFLAAGLLGLAVESAWRVRRRLRPVALGGVLLVLASVTPLTRFPSAAVYEPPFFRSPDVGLIPAGSLVVVAPFPVPGNVSTLRWQAAAGFRYRMAGGYALAPGDDGKPSFSGPDTATHEVLSAIQQGATVESLDFLAVVAMREEMRTSGASTVLVGPMAHQDNAVALFREVLGAPPTLTRGGVVLWTGVPSLLR